MAKKNNSVNFEDVTLQVKYNGEKDELIPKSAQLATGELYFDQTQNKLYCGNGSQKNDNLSPVNGVSSDSGKIFNYTIKPNYIYKSKEGTTCTFSFGDCNATDPDDSKNYIFYLSTTGKDNPLCSLNWEGVFHAKELVVDDLRADTADGALKLINKSGKGYSFGNTNTPIYFASGVPGTCTGWIPTSINGHTSAPSDAMEKQVYVLTEKQRQQTEGKFIQVGKNGFAFSDTKAPETTDIEQTGMTYAFGMTVESDKRLVVNSGDHINYTFENPVGNSVLHVDGQVKANSFNAVSDARKKENISSYTNDKSILDIDVKTFNYISDESKQKQIGIIAQDLQEICPELVVKDTDGYLTIKESKLIYVLLNEVKQLKQRIEQLEAKSE